MALAKIHNWSVGGVGEIGVDVLFDNTDSRSGPGSIKLTGALAVEISSAPVAIDNDRAHLLECVLKASSTLGGRTVTIDGLSIGIGKSLAPPHPTIYSAAVLPSTNYERIGYVWEPTANARFIILQIAKAAVSFDVNIDSFGTRPLPWAFRAYNTSATSIANASFTTVDFDTEDYDWGGHFASNQFTAPRDMLMHFDAYVEMDNTLAAGTWLVCRFTVNKGAGPSYHYIDKRDVVTTNITEGRGGGATIRLSKGDTVEVEMYQDSGGARNTSTASTFVYFSGHEIALPPF